jgi:glycosyltransferase involved in cell wall biosynthesis
MPPKVLHVIARMNVGGTARYITTLIENIPNSYLATGFTQGAEIEDSHIEKLKPFRIYHLGRKISPVNDLISYFELRKVIREIKPDIIHSHTFKAGLISRLQFGNYKRIHTFHGHLFEDNSFSKLIKILIRFMEKVLAKRSDLLISVGEKVGEELRQLGIGKYSKWQSIPPGVKPLPKVDKPKARELLNINTDGLLIGWMARMAKVKNPLRLLEVAKKLPDVNFVMAGGGDMLEQVRDSATANVNVIGWASAEVFWSAVDIAISTSYNEGMPVALIEAQLSGLPVIATDVGSSCEVILNESTGLITSTETESIVKAVKALMEDKSKLEILGANAAKRARLNFNVENMIALQMDAYKLI